MLKALNFIKKEDLLGLGEFIIVKGNLWIVMYYLTH